MAYFRPFNSQRGFGFTLVGAIFITLWVSAFVFAIYILSFVPDLLKALIHFLNK